MTKSNIRKALPLIIIFVWTAIISPFITNNCSFKFLSVPKYWASMVPMILLVPILIYVAIKDREK
ncbi:hypothetical protein [Hathewaya massiliensis]|uniref:hypothetical protein n=1 Tax=Hathewaya massiliensis TaxID=1964382 RepID=UPI00115719C6|nr:hypothetical protein [Hathewaya massiliensis]